MDHPLASKSHENYSAAVDMSYFEPNMVDTTASRQKNGVLYLTYVAIVAVCGLAGYGVVNAVQPSTSSLYALARPYPMRAAPIGGRAKQSRIRVVADNNLNLGGAGSIDEGPKHPVPPIQKVATNQGVMKMPVMPAYASAGAGASTGEALTEPSFSDILGQVQEQNPQKPVEQNIFQRFWSYITGFFAGLVAAAVSVLTFWKQRARGAAEDAVLGAIAKEQMKKNDADAFFGSKMDGRNLTYTTETGEQAFNNAMPANTSNMSMKDIVSPVSTDLNVLQQNLRNLVAGGNPTLSATADMIFGAGGKRMRPALVFLVARATLELGGKTEMVDNQRRLAEITEMIHTASLLHDDVLDDSDTRRGENTAHTVFSPKIAILAGDFLFAQSSWGLAQLENLQVIKLISQVIADFANGEISQATQLYNPDRTMQDYMDKSFFKTGSLIAASAMGSAVFSEVDPKTQQAMFNYGRHLGLAFQIVDDLLDFTADSETLGKPAGSDLASGNLTAPAIYAMPKSPRLRELVLSKFKEPGSLQEAIDIITNGPGVEKSRILAAQEGQRALAALEVLPPSRAKESLQGLVGYVLERIY